MTTVVQLTSPVLIFISGLAALYFQRQSKRQKNATAQAQESTSEKVSAEAAEIIMRTLHDNLQKMSAGDASKQLRIDQMQAWIDILETWIRTVKSKYPELVTPMETRTAAS